MTPSIQLKNIPANEVRDFFVATLPVIANIKNVSHIVDTMYMFMPDRTEKTTTEKANAIVDAIRTHDFKGSAEDLVHSNANVSTYRSTKHRTRKQHGGQPKWMHRMLGFAFGAISAAVFYTNPENPEITLVHAILGGVGQGIAVNVMTAYIMGLVEELDERRLLLELERVHVPVPVDTTNVISYDTIVTGDRIVRIGTLVNERMFYYYFKHAGITDWWRRQDELGQVHTNPMTSETIDHMTTVLHGIAHVNESAAVGTVHGSARRNSKKYRKTRKISYKTRM